MTFVTVEPSRDALQSSWRDVADPAGSISHSAYHQDYLARNPNQPYIIINDLPKIASLKQQFPALYVGK